MTMMMMMYLYRERQRQRETERDVGKEEIKVISIQLISETTSKAQDVSDNLNCPSGFPLWETFELQKLITF